MIEPLLTAEEVSKILRTTESIVIDGMKQGALPHIRVGSKWLMSQEQLGEWIRNPKEFRSR